MSWGAGERERSFSLPALVLCKVELQLGSASHAGVEECCFHGSTGASEKPSEALGEMVFNLKEKPF